MTLTPYWGRVMVQGLLSALKLVYWISWSIHMLLMHSLLPLPKYEYEQLPLCRCTPQNLFSHFGNHQKLGPETSCWSVKWGGKGVVSTCVYMPLLGAYNSLFWLHWSWKHAKSSITTIGIHIVVVAFGWNFHQCQIPALGGGMLNV